MLINLLVNVKYSHKDGKTFTLSAGLHDVPNDVAKALTDAGLAAPAPTSKGAATSQGTENEKPKKQAEQKGKK